MSSRSTSTGRLGGGAGADARGAARAVPTSSTRACSRERWRGLADFLVRVEAVGARRLELRGARHEARALAEAGLHPAAAASTTSSSPRLQGASRSEIHVLLGSGEQSVVPAGGVRRLLPARPRPARAFVADPPATEAAARRALRHLRLQAALRRALGRGRPPLARGRHPQRADREAGCCRASTRLPALGRAPDEPVRPGSRRRLGRRSASRRSCSSWARETGDDSLSVSCRRSRGPGSRCCRSPRRAICSSTSRATRSGTRAAGSSTSGGSSTPSATSRRCTRTTTRASGWRSRRSSTSSTSGWSEYPDLHVYHYAQYEITALRRLMGRYGTREAELDDLLRRGVFVDLSRVVRNGIRASRPGYGLKELEAFLDFARRAEVKDGGTSIVVFEQWMQTRDDALLRADRRVQPRGLHRDAAAARLAARASRRGDRAVRAVPAARAEAAEADSAREGGARRAARAAALDAGHELAAQLLDYHDRERKPVWWAFFDRIEMTPDELVEDAESIGRLAARRRAASRSSGRSPTRSRTPPRSRRSARAELDRPGDRASRRARCIEHDREARAARAEARRARSATSRCRRR